MRSGPIAPTHYFISLLGPVGWLGPLKKFGHVDGEPGGHFRRVPVEALLVPYRRAAPEPRDGYRPIAEVDPPATLGAEVGAPRHPLWPEAEPAA